MDKHKSSQGRVCKAYENNDSTASPMNFYDAELE